MQWVEAARGPVRDPGPCPPGHRCHHWRWRGRRYSVLLSCTPALRHLHLRHHHRQPLHSPQHVPRQTGPAGAWLRRSSRGDQRSLREVHRERTARRGLVEAGTCLCLCLCRCLRLCVRPSLGLSLRLSPSLCYCRPCSWLLNQSAGPISVPDAPAWSPRPKYYSVSE